MKAVADHQPAALLVHLAAVSVDERRDLGLQRRRQHLPGAVADDLIQQPTPTEFRWQQPLPWPPWFWLPASAWWSGLRWLGCRRTA